MKKIAVIIMAFMLLFGLTGQAMAYFEEGHLIRVLYTKDVSSGVAGEKEIVTDLGGDYNFTSPTATHYSFATDANVLSDLNVSSWNQVYVAYFALTSIGQSGANHLWLSGEDNGQAIKKAAWSNSQSAYNNFTSSNSLSQGARNVNIQSGDYSYSKQMGLDGRFAGIVSTASNSFMDKGLAGFDATGQQYVDQYLYYYASPNFPTGADRAGLNIYTIRTYEDGHTEINPTAIPIPAAFYLLGTGLLGLIGIRRKMATA